MNSQPDLVAQAPPCGEAKRLHHIRDPCHDGRCHPSPRARSSFDAVVRIDTSGEADRFRNGGILQYALRGPIE
ncbi:hypothetical protein ABT354_01325 [Streptomyces sp. NPDC000594]|uniref:hypothetical protein n=1 Tax=Streptomyces sp. NPDC000594 TaxID=3154261 RepID=UPI003331CA2F